MSNDHRRNPIYYQSERQYLSQAVARLVGAGSIEYRLGNAAHELIILSEPSHETLEDLPELRREFRAIIAELTKFPAELGDDGTVGATIRQLTSEECVALARRILDLYVSLLGGWPE